MFIRRSFNQAGTLFSYALSKFIVIGPIFVLRELRGYEVVGLRFLFRIHFEKRQEFLQSVATLLPPDLPYDFHQLLLHAVDDDNQYCFLLECMQPQTLKDFMQSARYRALLGAIKALGALDTLEVIEHHSVSREALNLEALNFG
jgi:hypothetical protein